MTDFYPLPTHSAIIALAAELRADAAHRRDDRTVRQLDRVIVGLTCGATLERRNGGLLVGSVNTPGAVYATNGDRCTCQSSRPCWHAMTHELIATLDQTAADTADMEAALSNPDEPGEEPGDGPNPGDSEPGIGPPTEGDECPDQYRMTLSAYCVNRLIIAPRRAHGARLAQARTASAYAV